MSILNYIKIINKYMGVFDIDDDHLNHLASKTGLPSTS